MAGGKGSGTVLVKIAGDASGLKGALSASEAGVAGLAGKFSGLAKAVTSPVGIAVTAIATIGVGLFKVGENFDEAYRKIRANTGATGDTLKGLEQSMKNVFAKTPADMGDVADAIGKVHQRLDLVGKPLEETTLAMLRLSRITKTDLNQTLEAATGLFNQFGVTGEDQTKVLDELFRAGQASGVGVGDLMAQLTSAGPTLRGVGFDLESSAALLAQLGKNGIESGSVMAGLRKEFGKFAKAGQDPAIALRELIGQIKDAPDPIQGMQKAVEIFGARAGAQMFDVIRSGKFDISAMLDIVKNGKDTLANAGADVKTMAGAWKLLSHNLQVLVEPIATRVFKAISGGVMLVINHAIPVIKRFGGALSALARGDVTGFAQILDGIFGNTGHLVGIFRTFGSIIDGVIDTWRQAFAGVKEIFGLVVKAFQTGDWTPVGEALKRGLQNAWDTALAGVRTAVATIQRWWDSIDWTLVGETIRAGFQKAVDVVVTLTGIVQRWWDSVDWAAVGVSIKTGYDKAHDFVVDLNGKVRQWVDSVDWAGVGANLQAGWNTAIAAAVIDFAIITDAVRRWFNSVDWANVGTTIMTGVQAAFDSIGTLLGTLSEAFARWIEAVDWNRIGQVIGQFLVVALDALTAATEKIALLAGALGLLIGKALAQVDWVGIGTQLEFAMVDLGIGLATGIAKGLVGSLKDKVSSMLGSGGLMELSDPGVTDAQKEAYWAEVNRKRASGGPVMAGVPYVVGERGPELFMPSGSGSIVPNGRLAMSGGGGGNTYVVNVSALSPNPADISKTVVAAIQEHERRNGTGWRN